jgi:DNA replication licensing factor MCM7
LPLLTEDQYENDTNEGLKLVESIESNTKHYVDIVSKAIDKKMPAPTTGVT